MHSACLPSVSDGQISENRRGKKEDVPTHRTIGIMLIGDLCQNVELFFPAPRVPRLRRGRSGTTTMQIVALQCVFPTKESSVSDAENLSSVSGCKWNNIICTRSCCLSIRTAREGAAVGELCVLVLQQPAEPSPALQPPS